MSKNGILRTALGVSVPFNFLAAYAVAFPSSLLGQLMGLPAEVPVLYAFMLAWMILLFGLVYAWLALQRVIDRPIVGVAGIAKAGVFVLVLVLWFEGMSSGRLAFFASGDFVFACVFFWWLVSTRRNLVFS